MPKRIQQILGILLILTGVLSLGTAVCRAHSPGQALINLRTEETGITGTISIYYGDLPLLIDGLPFQVPSPTDEFLPRYADLITLFLSEHIRFFSSGRPLADVTRFEPRLTFDEQDNAIIPLTIRPPSGRLKTLIIEQDGIYRLNPRFTTLVNLETDNQFKSIVLRRGDSRAELFIDPLTETMSFLGFGITHILSGIDHIAFILLLILSPFLAGAAVSDDWKAPAWALIKLATAFTVAHSLTLFLAVLKVMWMPAKLIDVMVIFSIVFVGLHNLLRFDIKREWLIVFAFGLFHGYGFSRGLQNAGLSRDHLLLPLLGFNVGVEIGQVLIIAVVFSLFCLTARRWRPHTVKAARWTTGFVTLVATLWLLEKILA